MRFCKTVLAGLVTLMAAAPAAAQNDAFLGAWNLTAPAEGYVYWLEVKNEGGNLTALCLNRGGSPVPVKDVKIAGGELSFLLPGNNPNNNTANLRASGGTLSGTIGSTVKVVGERPPQWAACDANAKHAFGKPVALFDGKSLTAWGVHRKDRPMGWVVEGDAMTNEPKANNLVSNERFKDFRLDAEFKVSPKGNSGIYLRGRYEMQVLDDAGTEPESHGNMAIYARKAPSVVASKSAGEWQTVQITLVGNCVSATLNGKTIHNNSKITGITGGALDAKETEPGPIMIQGDHEKVWFRKVTVTPIVSAGTH